MDFLQKFRNNFLYLLVVYCVLLLFSLVLWPCMDTLDWLLFLLMMKSTLFIAWFLIVQPLYVEHINEINRQTYLNSNDPSELFHPYTQSSSTSHFKTVRQSSLTDTEKMANSVLTSGLTEVKIFDYGSDNDAMSSEIKPY
jgi:hypothetical protein